MACFEDVSIRVCGEWFPPGSVTGHLSPHDPATMEMQMDSTMKRRTRLAGCGLLGSVLLIGLAGAPAQARTLDPLRDGSTWGSAEVPQLTNPFSSIVDLEAQRAEEERLAAEAQRQRAKERREKAEAAARKRANTKYIPVDGRYNLTARFGDWGGYWSGGRHTGLDFAAAWGTDVRCAQAGTVIAAGWEGAYGQRLEIQHADGTVTTYNHLSAIHVSVGDAVGGGQHVGDVGTTGNTTGSHLHFEVINPAGTMVDPAGWLGPR